MRVSIVVLTRNRSILLKQCLDSLSLLNKKTFEIIIVDNGSNDDTKKILKKYRNIKLIKNKINLGVAKGRNQGVVASSGKFIVLLDDDAFIKNGSFSKIIKYMTKYQDIGIVGPKALYPNGNIQESARTFPTLPAIIWRGTFLSKLFPYTPFYSKYILANINHRKTQEVDWVLGACQIIRRGVFETIGLLDERYFFGYEDIDFCLRAKKAGWKVIYYPHAKIYHQYTRASAKGIINYAKLHHLKSIIYFFIKHKILY